MNSSVFHCLSKTTVNKTLVLISSSSCTHQTERDKRAGNTAGGDGSLKPCVHEANPHGPPLSPSINTVLKTSLPGQHQLEKHGPHELTQPNNADSYVVTSKQFQKVRDLLDGTHKRS